MNRQKLIFNEFFKPGHADVEGTDVYEVDEMSTYYLGSINWVLPNDIEMMEDDELERLLWDNGIFPPL